MCLHQVKEGQVLTTIGAGDFVGEASPFFVSLRVSGSQFLARAFHDFVSVVCMTLYPSSTHPKPRKDSAGNAIFTEASHFLPPHIEETLHICARVYIYLYICIYIYICISFLELCMSIYMCTCTCICMYVQVFVCVCAYVHVYVRAREQFYVHLCVKRYACVLNP